VSKLKENDYTEEKCHKMFNMLKKDIMAYFIQVELNANPLKKLLLE
jgi:hypothetical protein